MHITRTCVLPSQVKRQFYTKAFHAVAVAQRPLPGGMEGDVLRMKKQSAVLGTCETAAFILSLRDGNEFCKTHSSGYLCTPHIGELVLCYFLFPVRGGLSSRVLVASCTAMRVRVYVAQVRVASRIST